MVENEDWLYEINAKQPLIHIDLKEIWRYKDLLFLFVRRDIIAAYKQTILGPLWYLIQPLFTGIILTLVFNNIASISTGDAPPFYSILPGLPCGVILRSVLTILPIPLPVMRACLLKFIFRELSLPCLRLFPLYLS